MWRLAGAFAFLLQPALADDITSASYGAPTDRYAHGVLGDAIEWGTLELKSVAGPTYKIVLPQTRVFEDTEPRLVDIDTAACDSALGRLSEPGRAMVAEAFTAAACVKTMRRGRPTEHPYRWPMLSRMQRI